MSPETPLLLSSLTRQREHILGALDGLSDEQLRQPVLPSGWCGLTLVKHLALDVEHYWFRCIVAGESLDVFPEHGGDGNGAWTLGPDESAEDVLDLYRQEIARSDAVIDATPLEAPPARRDEWWGDWEVPDLRFVLLHVITETACHAGHLDAARELIDGSQWIVLS